MEHDLEELLVVAVNAVLVGADTFVEIELWAREKLDWLRGYLRLMHGIPSHDTFGRLLAIFAQPLEKVEMALLRPVLLRRGDDRRDIALSYTIPGLLLLRHK